MSSYMSSRSFMDILILAISSYMSNRSFMDLLILAMSSYMSNRSFMDLLILATLLVRYLGLQEGLEDSWAMLRDIGLGEDGELAKEESCSLYET